MSRNGDNNKGALAPLSFMERGKRDRGGLFNTVKKRPAGAGLLGLGFTGMRVSPSGNISVVIHCCGVNDADHISFRHSTQGKMEFDDNVLNR